MTIGTDRTSPPPPAQRSKQDGRKGADLLLEVPLGTAVLDAYSGECLHDLDRPMDGPILLLEGGAGGKVWHSPPCPSRPPTRTPPTLVGVWRGGGAGSKMVFGPLWKRTSMGGYSVIHHHTHSQRSCSSKSPAASMPQGNRAFKTPELQGPRIRTKGEPGPSKVLGQGRAPPFSPVVQFLSTVTLAYASQ